jgi:hypothetical protein
MNTDIIKLLIVIIQFLISYRYGLLHLLIVLLIVVLLYQFLNNIIQVLKDLLPKEPTQTKASAPPLYSNNEQRKPPPYSLPSPPPPPYTYSPSFKEQRGPPPYSSSNRFIQADSFQLLMRKDSHLKTPFYAKPKEVPNIQRPPTLLQTILRFPTNLFNLLRGEPRRY